MAKKDVKAEVPVKKIFTMSTIQMDGLRDARATDDPEKAEREFWFGLAAAQADFNPTTVEAADSLETGEFKAWPDGYEPAAQPSAADLSAAHEHAMDEMVKAADLAEFYPSSLVFDVRDLVITMMKSQDRLWHQKSEAEQRDSAIAAEHFSNVVIEKIAEAIVSRGQTTIRAICGKTTMGDKITVTLEVKTFTPAETDQAVMFLSHSFGKNVMISRASAQDFNTEARDAEIDADEPPLDFDADQDA